MSDSSRASSSSSSVEDESERERQEAEDDFKEMCARAVVSLCTRHHYDLLLDKGHSQQSASSITLLQSTLDTGEGPRVRPTSGSNAEHSLQRDRPDG